jgi:hypothetical protein
MAGWNKEEYFQREIERIRELQAEGCTDREILDMNNFSLEALEKAGLPLTNLVPQLEEQENIVFSR